MAESQRSTFTDRTKLDVHAVFHYLNCRLYFYHIDFMYIKLFDLCLTLTFVTDKIYINK